MTLPIPSTMIAYGLSAIEPALNPTPNQTSAGPSQQKNYEIGKLWQSSTSGKGSPLMVMIADSVLCSIFNPTWPRETAPARATWDMSRVQKSCCCFCCNIISRLETSLAVPQASDVWASLKIAWKDLSWPTSLSGEIVHPWGRLELLTWEEVVTWRWAFQTFPANQRFS